MAAVGVSALAAQTIAITKSALGEYATWEQAVGGIDTLFKDASGTVQSFADDAFRTAGVSANAYMQNVTSFSAALIGSLGGDTDAAAQLANQAMIDMSDNANKMGTDLASIQGTYQSLARGNFAMLDNLKLGYGGTKAELDRLLADASKVSGITYDASNFADIVSAIHIVQNELGITGTTALEAATTIEGSTLAMKASWSNWLTELGKTDGDVEGATRRLTESVGTAFENVVPRIGQILKGIVASIPTLLSGVAEALPQPFQDGIARISDASGGLSGALGPLAAGFGALGAVGILPMLSSLPVVGGLFSGLAAKLPLLTNPLFLAAAGFAAFTAAGGDFGQVGDLVVGIVDMIVAALPGMIRAVVEVVPKLVDGILSAIPELILAAVSIVEALVEGLVVALPLIIEGALALVNGLLTAVIQNLPLIIQAGITLLLAIVQGLITALPALITGAIQLVMGLIGAIVQNLPLILQAGIEVLLALIQGIIGALPMLLEGALQLVLALVTALVDNLPLLIEMGIGLLLALITGLCGGR